MKLTVAFRDTPAPGFSGVKHHYIAFHVEFSNEERAIVQERGLYDHFLAVPSDVPLSTKGDDFIAWLMRAIGFVITPLGALFALVGSLKPQEAAAAGPGWMMLLGGIALFVIGTRKRVNAAARTSNPKRDLTLRQLLANPDFLVHAVSIQEAREYEEDVRNKLAVAADTIRKSGAVPRQASYEL